MFQQFLSVWVPICHRCHPVTSSQSHTRCSLTVVSLFLVTKAREIALGSYPTPLNANQRRLFRSFPLFAHFLHFGHWLSNDESQTSRSWTRIQRSLAVFFPVYTAWGPPESSISGLNLSMQSDYTESVWKVELRLTAFRLQIQHADWKEVSSHTNMRSNNLTSSMLPDYFLFVDFGSWLLHLDILMKFLVAGCFMPWS